VRVDDMCEGERGTPRERFHWVSASARMGEETARGVEGRLQFLADDRLIRAADAVEWSRNTSRRVRAVTLRKHAACPRREFRNSSVQGTAMKYSTCRRLSDRWRSGRAGRVATKQSGHRIRRLFSLLRGGQRSDVQATIRCLSVLWQRTLPQCRRCSGRARTASISTVMSRTNRPTCMSTGMTSRPSSGSIRWRWPGTLGSVRTNCAGSNA